MDARFSVRPDRPEPVGVAVVGVDDQTFDDLREQWPFPRSMHAKVIDRLRRDGAKVIAYDVQFTEETAVAEDNALIEAVQRARPMVLSTTEVDERGRSRVFGGDAVLESVGARAGNTVLGADSAGVFRTVPFSVTGLESFAVAATELADRRRVDPADFTEDRGSAWIDFAGGPGSVRTVSFSRVLRGRFAPGTFRGRVVVVGATATSLQDVHPTSTTTGRALMAGPEIQASAIDTVRRGLPLRSTPGIIDALLVLLLAVAVPLVAARSAFRWAVTAAVGLAVGYPVIAQLLFGAGTVIPVAVPMLGLAFATVTTTAGHALLTAAERERTRDLFARFVPAAVVSDVLARVDDDLRLGGQRREGTVMFCDLRGFTSFAEHVAPDRVIDVLNHYLSEMSDAIMEQEGTLVAFMGDGIMAVFGAPLDHPDHADRAVIAAREMLSVRLPRFNAWLRAEGFERTFRMGIGLNSGAVMSGNVGSRTRMEYTAIGDTTNTASRFEAMTKDEGVQVLLSAATREAVRDDAIRATLTLVGPRAIRGRDQTIEMWTIAP